jgi:predicted dehydrogenase
VDCVFVGAGAVADQYAAGLDGSPLRLAGVCDLDTGRAERLAAAHGADAFTDLGSALDALDAPLALNLTSHAAHVGRVTEWHDRPDSFLAVGPLYDGAVYPLSLLVAWFGPVQRVRAADVLDVWPADEEKNPEAPTHIEATLSFDGPVVRLTASLYVPHRSREFYGLELHGDGGSIYLRDAGGRGPAPGDLSYALHWPEAWVYQGPLRRLAEKPVSEQEALAFPETAGGERATVDLSLTEAWANLEGVHERGIRVVAHSPLSAPGLLDEDVLAEIAADRALSPAGVVLAWNVTEGVVPIPSSITPAHVVENLRAASARLTDAEREQIATLEDPEFTR